MKFSCLNRKRRSMYIARVLYICKIDRAFYYYTYIYIYINNKVIYIYFNQQKSKRVLLSLILALSREFTASWLSLGSSKRTDIGRLRRLNLKFYQSRCVVQCIIHSVQSCARKHLMSSNAGVLYGRFSYFAFRCVSNLFPLNSPMDEAEESRARGARSIKYYYVRRALHLPPMVRVDD